MKVNFLFPIILFFSLFLSCQTDINDVSKDEPSLIYSDDNLKIENISKTATVFNSFVESDAWLFTENIECDLDYTDIRQYTFTYSAVKMLSIPIGATSKHLIVYVYDNKYLPIISEEIKLADKESKVILTDNNDNIYKSFVINDKKVVSSFQGKEIPSYASFGKKIGISNSGTTLKSVQEKTCDEKTDNFSDCMDCAVDEMTDGWLAIAAFALMPGPVLAACAIHCM